MDVHPNWSKLVPDPEQPWTRIRSEQVVPPPYSIQVDDVQTHTDEIYRYVYRPRSRGAAFILPITPQGQVVLVHQYRYPLQRYIWEIPAGALDEGETPQQAAARELREEVGAVARTYIPLPGYYASPSFSGTPFYPFLALDVELRFSVQHEPTELMEFELFDVREVFHNLEQGYFLDANTSLVMFHARPYLGAWLSDR